MLAARFDLEQITNLVSWDKAGTVLSDVILSDASVFVAETVLTPDGTAAYLFTAPEMQQTLKNNGANLEVDTCQLYRVGLTGGDGFECSLDQNDPRVQVSTVGVKLRDDFLRQSISFRADGTGVLETYDGPMLLKPDGLYVMYNQTVELLPMDLQR